MLGFSWKTCPSCAAILCCKQDPKHLSSRFCCCWRLYHRYSNRKSWTLLSQPHFHPVANNQMLRRLYEICSLHLNKFYPLPPQISGFWKLMDSIFELLQNWTTQRFTIMKMWRISKRNHVNMSLSHNMFKRDIWPQVTKGPPMTSFARLCNSRWRMLRTLKQFFNV